MDEQSLPFLFIVPGILIMWCCRALAAYQLRSVQSQLNDAIKRRSARLEAGLPLWFNDGEITLLETRLRRESGVLGWGIYLIMGAAATALGIFAYFHPHGW